MTISPEMMKGTLVPITLKLLSEREMYGYEILREVNARSEDVLAWKEAALYPWLHRLEQERLIRGQWRTGDSGRRRKYYALTKKGSPALAGQVAEWRDFSQAVSSILTPLYAG